MFQVGHVFQDPLHLGWTQNRGQFLLFFWPGEIIIRSLPAKHLLVVELDRVDPLVLLTGRDMLFPDQFQHVPVDIGFGNGFEIPAFHGGLEVKEVVRVDLDGILTVALALKQLQVSRREKLVSFWSFVHVAWFLVHECFHLFSGTAGMAVPLFFMC